MPHRLYATLDARKNLPILMQGLAEFLRNPVVTSVVTVAALGLFLAIANPENKPFDPDARSHPTLAQPTGL